MLFRHLYDVSLSQSSYLIACERTREAIVVDPLRGADRYLDLAAREQARIVAVVETHIPSDYCSGARELAVRTGARLYVSGCGGTEASYVVAADGDALALADGDVIDVGMVRLSAVHTPGHAPEHLCFVVADYAVGATPIGVLTGDLLFAGDVGRPEFFGAIGSDPAATHTDAMALHRSLARLAALPDFLQIWPGHGAGELHARAVTATPQSTLGYERQVNWALRPQADDEFTATLLRDPPDLPQCRRALKAMNRAGAVVTSGTGEVTTRSRLEAQEWIAGAGFVVDARPADLFAQAFLPGSLNIPGTRSFTRWFGSLITHDLPVWLLVTDEAQGAALLHDLQLIGFDGVVGVTVASDALAGTFSTALASRSAVALAGSLGRDGVTVLDVRSRAEFTSGHVAGALHVPLGELPQRLAEVPAGGTLVTTCADGECAAIAASLLLMAGAPAVENLHGGLAAWTTAGYTLTTITD